MELGNIWDRTTTQFGTCVVSSVKEFRENASECFGWARTAKTDKERDIFLQMARAWLDAAARHEGVSQPPNAPSVPGRGDSPSAVRGGRATAPPFGSPPRRLSLLTGRVTP
jgi:hypothetical protein